MTEDVTYAVENDLSPDEFIDVLRRSGLARTSQTRHGLRGAVPPTGQESRAARCGDIGQAA